MKIFSTIISLVFHPLFIPIYIVLLLFSLPILEVQRLNTGFKYVLIGLLIVNNILLPIASFYFLKQKGSIQSFQMKTASERNFPYLLIFVFYGITSYMLMRISYLDPIFTFIPIAAGISVLTLIPINRYIKISAHMASNGSAIAFLFLIHFYFQFNMLIPIIIAIFFGGITASSRLYLKAHSPEEIYSGFLVGALITLLAGTFYLF